MSEVATVPYRIGMLLTDREDRKLRCREMRRVSFNGVIIVVDRIIATSVCQDQDLKGHVVKLLLDGGHELATIKPGMKYSEAAKTERDFWEHVDKVLNQCKSPEAIAKELLRRKNSGA